MIIVIVGAFALLVIMGIMKCSSIADQHIEELERKQRMKEKNETQGSIS